MKGLVLLKNQAMKIMQVQRQGDVLLAIDMNYIYTMQVSDHVKVCFARHSLYN